MSNICEKISGLVKRYADNLKVIIGSRLEEMKYDDTSHYLIYRVLGVQVEEGRLIDEYQNKGRFLYRYAGSFLEEAAILCFEEKFSNAERKVRISNTLGVRPKTFEIDCLVENNAYEIKWRDATTDSDHTTKEHIRFFTQCRQTLKDKNLNEYSFDDQWTSIEDYKSFMKERLSECQRILKKTGSIFLHCDRYASHHLRIILDEVFGAHNFQSEIIWSYKRWSNAKKGLLNAHQVIFFYSKTNKFAFNPIYNGYSEATNIDQIFQKRKRDRNGKTVYRTSELGNYELIKEKKGVPLSDVWEIPYLNPKARERVGYPTQKPILLLERIVEIASNPGDTILDPFCGSGTTLVAAKLLGREYLGIDTSSDAVALSEKRLENPIKSDSALLKRGRLAYSNQDTEILSLLNQIEAEPVQRNRFVSKEKTKLLSRQNNNYQKLFKKMDSNALCYIRQMTRSRYHCLRYLTRPTVSYMCTIRLTQLFVTKVF